MESIWLNTRFRPPSIPGTVTTIVAEGAGIVTTYQLLLNGGVPYLSFYPASY